MQHIVKYPDPVLMSPCEAVFDLTFGPELDKKLDEMREAMDAEGGIGLAANQLGWSVRVFIMRDQKGNLHEFVNPTIVDREGLQQINEGCLSAPGVFVQVPRAAVVTVSARNRRGEHFQVLCEGIEAVCVQHELDHLDGVFFLEKTSRNQRRAALRTLGLK